ncbi:DUF2938 domain-containing protein [Hyphococcus lacteus]|uniref:DUF2938 domain-containing protein n=1 Tax=Hyphococcus lacteus TaxID=3143536 RepID=A0ABV3Z2Y6_9PROT
MTILETTLRVAAIGVIATLILDIFNLARAKFANVPSLNFALVGRWVLWMPKGKFLHQTILDSPAMRFEAIVGWTIHYAIGIAFAACLLPFPGRWLETVTVIPSLIVGIGGVVAPFFIMQPSFGFGFAASKMPAPWTARQRSVVSHFVFGLGLYCAGSVVAQF